MAEFFQNLNQATLMVLIFAAVLLAFLIVLIVVTVKVTKMGKEDKKKAKRTQEDDDLMAVAEEALREEVADRESKRDMTDQLVAEANDAVDAAGNDDFDEEIGAEDDNIDEFFDEEDEDQKEAEEETEEIDEDTEDVIPASLRDSSAALEYAAASAKADAEEAANSDIDARISAKVDEVIASEPTNKLDTTKIEEALKQSGKLGTDNAESIVRAKERAESPEYDATFDSAFVEVDTKALAAEEAKSASIVGSLDVNEVRARLAESGKLDASENETAILSEKFEEFDEDLAEKTDELTGKTQIPEESDEVSEDLGDEALDEDQNAEVEDEEDDEDFFAEDDEEISEEAVAQAPAVAPTVAPIDLSTIPETDATGKITVNPVNQVNINTVNNDATVNTKNPNAGINDMGEMKEFLAENPVPQKKKKKIKKKDKKFEEKFGLHGDEIPVARYFWYNNQDIEELTRKEDMYFYCHYFDSPDESIIPLVTEMYDCAFVRTEEIQKIAYGITFHSMGMKEILKAQNNVSFDRNKATKEPTVADLQEIYEKWCGYVDNFLKIIVINAPDAIEEYIKEKLYEYGHEDVETLLYSPE